VDEKVQKKVVCYQSLSRMTYRIEEGDGGGAEVVVNVRVSIRRLLGF